ncbi:hypothetical protein AB1Y20_011183 [Prymnesium parvum]|uniref:MMS19 nucleotide excision repair protein n=1 Tax=Prymnesium parvum TaxID=97485 RepID=A0AB34IM65_PRYPA
MQWAEASLAELWRCFLPGRQTAEAASRLAEAPARTRACASLLEAASVAARAGDQHSLEAFELVVTKLFDGLRALSDERRPPDDTPDAARRPRALFLCAVLLCQGAFASAPPECVARHTEQTLRALLRLSEGAVLAPQLAQLEALVLEQLPSAECLVDMTMELASGEEPPRETQQALVLRWLVAALELPRLAGALHANLPRLVHCALHLEAPATAAADLLFAALHSLCVDEEAHCALAMELIHLLVARCKQALSVEASMHPHRPPTGGGSMTSPLATVPSDSRRGSSDDAEALCDLCFRLTIALELPLLTSALSAAEELVTGCPAAWQCTRSAATLREAISNSFESDLKHLLVQWLLRLRAKILSQLPPREAVS